MPDTPRPKPESSQELAWRRANPLLAELTTARIRELRAEQRAAESQLRRAQRDEQALREWREQHMDPLPFEVNLDMPHTRL